MDEDGQTVIPPRVLGYDTLVIAVGSLSNDFGTPGVNEHAIALDTLDQASRFNRRMINACLRANAQYEPLRPGQLHVAIVGAGATGVELAAELHKTMRDVVSYNLDRINPEMRIRIELIEAAPRILRRAGRLGGGDRRGGANLGVNIRTGASVMDVRAGEVVLASGEIVPAELIVWAAGIKAPDFFANSTDRDRQDQPPGGAADVTDDARRRRVRHRRLRPQILPGATEPLPPRAQTAHQQADFIVEAVKLERLRGAPPRQFNLRDFGSLVALRYSGTLGVLFIT